MKVFTVHETKRNSIGTFACRVLGIEENGTILLVRPCINPLCPDLGFRKCSAEKLQGEEFKELLPVEDLDGNCMKDILRKFQEKNLDETDEEFSKQWFTEIARVTQLERFQLKTFSSLVENRP